MNPLRPGKELKRKELLPLTRESKKKKYFQPALRIRDSREGKIGHWNNHKRAGTEKNLRKSFQDVKCSLSNNVAILCFRDFIFCFRWFSWKREISITDKWLPIIRNKEEIFSREANDYEKDLMKFKWLFVGEKKKRQKVAGKEKWKRSWYYTMADGCSVPFRVLKASAFPT